MKAKIFYFGNIKTDFINIGISQYVKWISKYEKLELIQFPLTKNLNKLSPDEYKKKDYERLINHVKKTDFNIMLDETGKQFTSIEFSKKYSSVKVSEKIDINFFIGGPIGHYYESLNNANLIMSLSKMTFTHEMAVLLILEQIYRANKILNNESYHY
jgi:23S rRNA (pseudouridine1915-N3)-methyltransferase